MELTWYGRTCVRLKGRDAVVVADPYQSVVGPTGRGITAEIVTYSHPDDAPLARAKGTTARDGKTLVPGSLEDAFILDGPGEYEIRHVLLTGVRTYRDDTRGAERGRQTAFVVELDQMHTIHLGDIGHLLTEEKLGDIGSVDIACVPIGGNLSATRAAELIAQLDPKIVVPMPVCEAGLRRGARQVLPRDGRRTRPGPGQAPDRDVRPARGDDGRPPRVPRQAIAPRGSAGGRPQARW
jgi:L-ascorbate metabolism protein UlaG (beta-lactamase superfamily)